MSDSNLTRDEAEARAALLTVHSYDVSLDLTVGAELFTTTSRISVDCADPGASTFVDFTGRAVREVTLNGTAVDPPFDGNRVELPALAATNEIVIVADGEYTNTGQGLHRFTDPVDGSVYLYTQFETYDAHRCYPCFDQPDLKATFTLAVTAPAGWQVISNGRVVDRPVGPVAGDWTFETTPPMSTYITAVVAGPYHHVHDKHGEIELGLYCRGSLAEFLDADEIFTITKQGFDWFENAFGTPYAFGKYDQLFVPEFNAGAMENAACVTFLEDYVFRSKVTDASRERRAETILHEMAHMWFGDLVTMRWWDDLWLNESFATYASILCMVAATRFTSAWTTFANVEKTWAYRQDQLPSTHPIAAEIPDIHAVEVNFDGITYAKGASVLKQLVAWVGEDAFLAGLRVYFSRHAYGNTELRDLLAVLEESSGRDLSHWSKEWLETAGVNTLRAAFETGADDTFTSFAITQEAPADWPTLRSHRIAIGLYDVAGDGLVRRERVEVEVTGADTDVAELVGQRRPDLVLVNDDDLTYAKIRLDDRSLDTLTGRLGQLPSSLARGLCWAAAWDMTRDAELATRDLVRLVIGNLPGETDIGVVQSLLAKAELAIYAYGDPGNREAALTSLADAAYSAAQASPPASDFQLAWLRSFASTARTEQQLDVVADLLTGAHTLPGLEVDTELRWALLGALVTAGRAGPPEIDAELARDNTAAGVRHAAAARAAQPTREAKEAAFRSIFDDDALPNAMLGATIGGFQQPDQVELVGEFTERYFDSLARVWETRSNEMAFTAITGMYPATQVSQETVDRTDRYLREAEPAFPVRRLLIEGRDGVSRALRARAKDAAKDGARH